VLLRVTCLAINPSAKIHENAVLRITRRSLTRAFQEVATLIEIDTAISYGTAAVATILEFLL